LTRTPPHKYTDEQIQFLKDHVKGRSYEDLWKLFNQQFNLDLKFTQITGSLKRYKLTNGINARFSKGQTAHNKGKKFPGKTNKTSFKKGQTAPNYKPVGSERITAKGYTLVKVAEPSEWKHKHVVEWENVHGPIPQGHCLIFLDGNRKNLAIENLKLITKAQRARMNQNHLFTGYAEGTKAGVLLADLYAKMSQRKKELKSGGKR